MSEIHWLRSISGNFTNMADWSGGVVPGASDDAILDAIGSSYTVTASHSETVDSIQLSPNAVLAVTGGTFSAIAGTGDGANEGLITIGAHGVLSIGGVFNNEGLISLSYSYEMPASVVAVANTTLTGGGTIRGSYISAAVAGVTITNVDNTINCSISTAAPGTTFKNKKHGVIATFSLGNYTDALSIVNFGTIEGVLSGGGNEAYVTNCNISGAGTIAVAAAEYFQFDGGGSIRGQRFSIAKGGTLALDALQFKYGGALNNAGNLVVYSGGPAPELYLKASTTLSGGGLLDLHSSAIGGAHTTLVNVDNTIAGAGDLGSGRVAIVNQAAGVIEVYTFPDPSGLVIDCGHATFVNAGLVESGGGILTIASVMDNTGTIVCSSGDATTFRRAIHNDGLIEVANTVNFDAAVKGTGSVLITSGAVIAAAGFRQSVTFQSGYGQDGVLELADSQDYRRTISGFELFEGPYGGTTLDLGDIGFVSSNEATFSGTASGGVLSVSDGTHTANIDLSGDYLSDTFTASSDGHGGVDIIAKADGAPTTGAFAAAMAGMGAGAGSAVVAAKHNEAWRPTLLGPRAQTA